jgi:protein TonB
MATSARDNGGWRRGGIFAVTACAHLFALFLIGRTPLAAPIALATITLDLVAAGDPVPEAAAAAQDTAPTEPSPALAEPPPAPSEVPQPPEQPTPQTEPEQPAEPIAPPVAAEPVRMKPPEPKPPATARKPQPRQQPQATSRPRRVGAREARAQRPGMSRAAFGALVIRQIQARRFYPAAARANGESGRVGVMFTIGGSGRAVSVSVTRSSGSASLDAAARAIVRGVSLPPPPGGVFTGATSINFSFGR